MILGFHPIWNTVLPREEKRSFVFVHLRNSWQTITEATYTNDW